jgi:methanogenic corrinoid protein MtbC1
MHAARYAAAAMTERTPGADPGPGWLTIGSLARATGIPVATLRTWERRYRFPVPSRRPSGHRLYPVASVVHLRAIRRALLLGRRPVEIMGLPLPRLEALVADAGAEAPSPAPAPRGSSSPGPRAPRHAPADIGDSRAIVERCLATVRRYDLDAFADTLRLAWARLGPMEFLSEVAARALVELGEAWARGELDVRHEHLAAARLGEFLREVRRPYDEAAGGPVVAAATPPGDRHEMGLLMASLVFALRGYRVLYLGPDTPAGQITALAREIPLGGVVVSASGTGRRAARAMLRSLETGLPPGVPVWTGGAGAPPPGPRTTRADSLRDLFDGLPAAR